MNEFILSENGSLCIYCGTIVTTDTEIDAHVCPSMEPTALVDCSPIFNDWLALQAANTFTEEFNAGTDSTGQ